MHVTAEALEVLPAEMKPDRGRQKNQTFGDDRPTCFEFSNSRSPSSSSRLVSASLVLIVSFGLEAHA